MAKILNLDDIKSLPDVPTKTIDIPQWNVSIKVKGISKKMQIELGRLIHVEQTDAFDYQKALLIASVLQPKLNDEAIDEKRFFGWPISRDLGGFTFNLAYLGECHDPDNDLQISEIDSHPSKLGHEKIAKVLLEKYHSVI